MRILLAISTSVLICGAAAAQNIVPPPPGPNPDMGCLVQGLDPNGDGFLALRAGPGTNYAKIGELHNGDAAFIGAPCRTDRAGWCYVENGAKNGREARFRGWIFTRWCQFYP